MSPRVFLVLLALSFATGSEAQLTATDLRCDWGSDPLGIDSSLGASQNHFMLGQIMEWFYHDLVGLAPDPAGPGFARIIVRPEPVGDLRWAEASYETARGPVAMRWDRVDKRLRLAVTIPPNTRASVQLPVEEGTAITESGRPLAGRSDIATMASVDGRPTFEIGAGSYFFETR